MYGAFIGDIVGSKYEFHPIKTKEFPLFSSGCDYTDDTIMTVAVAKAILRSRQAQYHSEKEKGFQDFLIEEMKQFGRKYPYPTGAYGGKFSLWLRQEHPQPYGSYGNGSAMRVSPCGLAAVNLEEALALARASAVVTHNHPEGVKGAEAVAAAVFLAKIGKTKAEIGQYIREHYYPLNFTLDSIRETYRFDASCQGSVPQAIVAFLESESFEDAIRNAVFIGGDCDTTGAIAGSIAWVYYAMKSGQYTGWVYDEFDPAMLEIKARAMTYLPKEFIEIADEFHKACWQRAGTHGRSGFCTPILNEAETKKYWMEWEAPAPLRGAAPQYDLNYIQTREKHSGESAPGTCAVFHDTLLHKWRLKIQLDEERLWFLSVFVHENGKIEKYSLDEEAASDSHYEFQDEQGVRKALYVPGSEKRYFHEVLMRVVKEHGAGALLSWLRPYITAQFHYD